MRVRHPFTLLEVLLSLFIISIALLSLSQVLFSCYEQHRFSEDRVTAVRLAEETLAHFSLTGQFPYDDENKAPGFSIVAEAKPYQLSGFTQIQVHIKKKGHILAQLSRVTSHP